MTQSTAQARLETLAFVAKRIYDEESRGTVDQSPIRQLERDPALVQAVGRGNAAAVQAEARRQLAAAAHITGIRIVRGKRTLANIALAFVIGAKARPLPGASGSEIQISVQDVLGYVSLVHRVTGAEVVVRGSSGHVLSSLRAAGRTRLPGSGRLSLAGRRYALTSFGEPGWAGERLTVWLLEPV
jgi:hypothetical protein